MPPSIGSTLSSMSSKSFSSSASLFLPCRLVHSVACELILSWTLVKPGSVRWDRGWEGGSHETYVYLCLVHVVVWQKLAHREAIILQLKIKKTNKQTASSQPRLPGFKFCLFKRAYPDRDLDLLLFQI